MVTMASSYDFTALVDAFFASKTLGGPNAPRITALIRAKALDLLDKPDVRYMPTFKVMDLLAALTTIAVAVDQATQLRPTEIEVLLREALSENAPLARQFLLEAALERVRYEPLMLPDASPTTSQHEVREQVLKRRWAAMRAAHQERSSLPAAWMAQVDQAVALALESDDFRQFRQGPLLQLFAEMLALARGYHQQHQSLDSLEVALSEQGLLWRRYALKSARYTEKSSAPLNLFSMTPASHQLH